MSRITPLSTSAIPELQSIFDAAESMMGFVPNDGLLMAHQPHILRAFLALVQAIYQPGKVEGGLKRLLGLVASSAAGCRYCQAHAANAARDQLVPVEKLQAVWAFERSSLFSDAEKAALRLALKASVVPNETTDEDFKVLKEYYDEAQIIEMMAVVSMYGFLNRWNATLDTELEAVPAEFINKIK